MTETTMTIEQRVERLEAELAELRGAHEDGPDPAPPAFPGFLAYRERARALIEQQKESRG